MSNYFQKEKVRLETLRSKMKMRSEVLRHTRDWFFQEGFWEMSIPKISPYLSGEPGIFAVPVVLEDSFEREKNAYLLPSPEIHLKKLVGSGYEKIYELGWSYRDKEPFDSCLHNGEFFLLEWYRTGKTYKKIMQDVCDLISYLGSCMGGSATNWEYDGVSYDLTNPRYLSMQEAFALHAEIDLNSLSCWEDLKKFSLNGCEEVEDIFYQLYAQYIDANLGQKTLDIVYGFPNFAGGFSKLSAEDPRYSNRFEVYLGGMELANGYDELCAPELVRERIQSHQKGACVDECFVESLQSVESVSGVALGWDRLFMFLSGAKTIQEVLPFSYKNLFVS